MYVVFVIQSIGAVEIGPIGPEYVLVKRLEPNRVLFLHPYKVLDQIRSLWFLHRIHLIPANDLLFHVLQPQHL